MRLISFFRLEQLDTTFDELLQQEDQWLPRPLDMKVLYGHFYDEIIQVARNSVCGSCGCIDHDPHHFDLVPVTDH